MKKTFRYVGIVLIIGIFWVLFFLFWKKQKTLYPPIKATLRQQPVVRTELAPEAVAMTMIGRIQSYRLTETWAKFTADPFASIFTLPGHLEDFDHYIALLKSKEQEGFRKLTFWSPSTIIKVELLTPEELEQELAHRDLKK